MQAHHTQKEDAAKPAAGKAAKAPQGAKPQPIIEAPLSKVAAARAAVQHFLATELQAREIRITKMAPIGHGDEGWQAEAEIFLPNLDIKTLGLPLSQELLERQRYFISLGADLVVRSYEADDQDGE